MRRSLIAFAVAMGSLTLNAQDRPAFRTEANYIRVDMYPTIGGRPVDDLQASEVEIADQGVPQTIDRFERIRRQNALPLQAAAVQPEAVAAAAAPPTESPGRIFVLFLDSNHVDGNWGRAISQPLINALNTLIREGDLIAVMTADMNARNLTFVPRTTSIESVLRTNWGRDRRVDLTPEETELVSCYPGTPVGTTTGREANIAQELILRRREQRTLDALYVLVDRLGTLQREERKAVIAISYGWRLFEDDAELGRPGGRAVPSAPIGDGGRPADSVEFSGMARATPRCESARASLSRMRSEPRFREILDRANRTNTSFYPIDPRRVVVFDEDIVPAAGVGANRPIDLAEDRARLRDRQTSLQMMAEQTDGLAVINTSDIDKGMQRINDDLSSYYLLGFYSTQKQDGKFHKLTVRVKRKGVDARARRGYLATATSP